MSITLPVRRRVSADLSSLFLCAAFFANFADHSGREWRSGWGAQSAPSIACLWAVAFALNKQTTSVHRRFAPIANSQVADCLVRSSTCGRNWIFLDCKMLIFNNHARGMSPGGDVLETIELPVSQVTSCVFGGENLRTLYITSASMGLDLSSSHIER